MPSPQSPSQRPSLTSLPIELLTTIASQLDLVSAGALSVVSRAFNQLTEARRYRDLDLFLHPHFGESPLVQPYPKERGGAEYVSWANHEAQQAAARYELGLKEKVKRVLVDTGSRRLGMVKRVTVKPRPKAVDGILLLLDVVSPTLRELHIMAPEQNPYDLAWRPFDKDTLDVRSMRFGLTFPSLAHLHIGQYASRHAGFLLLLCSAAPGLVHVEADLRHDRNLDEPYTDSEPEYPARAVNTKIQHLRLSFDDRNDGFDSDDEDEEESAKARRRLRHPSLILLSRSPSIQQLFIEYEGDTVAVKTALVRAICQLTALKDLHWWGTLGELCQFAPGDARTLSALRRLVVSSTCPDDLVPDNISTPLLEALYVLNWKFSKAKFTPPSAEYPETLPAVIMPPHIASYLVHCPRLKVFHTIPHLDGDIFPVLDKIEAEGQFNGSIRSFRQGDAELVHLRRLLHLVEVYDHADVGAGRRSRGSHFMPYIPRDGTERVKRFDYQKEAAWVDATDLQGMAVPLDVIVRMRRAQGVSVVEWRGRGIEVNAEAWKVLTDWVAGQKAAGIDAE